MEKSKGLTELIGRNVKLVVKEPSDRREKAIFGVVEGVDNGFVVFRSQHGVGSYRLEYVVAIKPTGGSGR